MNNEKPSSYTVRQIMEILNISKTHAYEFVNNNPPFRILHAGKTIRVPKDSFNAWFFGSSDTNATIQPPSKRA